ncbi:uncharacterized protein LOC129592859 [Paramacrobiotus metropolitanus]|uniref:uncharacterized protein LOC129592859 n=1 Tax=Paramacrobiotus metropolitanus TaxID=2943436 RepID=UPI0024461CB0|nr:uncharacterized protein LOC129592859 [Paramacrobiotus metropolitanus]
MSSMESKAIPSHLEIMQKSVTELKSLGSDLGLAFSGKDRKQDLVKRICEHYKIPPMFTVQTRRRASAPQDPVAGSSTMPDSGNSAAVDAWTITDRSALLEILRTFRC